VLREKLSGLGTGMSGIRCRSTSRAYFAPQPSVDLGEGIPAYRGSQHRKLQAKTPEVTHGRSSGLRYEQSDVSVDDHHVLSLLSRCVAQTESCCVVYPVPARLHHLTVRKHQTTEPLEW